MFTLAKCQSKSKMKKVRNKVHTRTKEAHESLKRKERMNYMCIKSALYYTRAHCEIDQTVEIPQSRTTIEE